MQTMVETKHKSYTLQCLCANFRNISIMQCVNPMVSLVHKYGVIVKQEEVSVCQYHLVFLCICCVDIINILWANALINTIVTTKITVNSVFLQLLLNFPVEFILFILIEMMKKNILIFEDVYLIVIICACLGKHQLILL